MYVFIYDAKERLFSFIHQKPQLVCRFICKRVVYVICTKVHRLYYYIVHINPSYNDTL